ncbi:phosphoribosyl transferase-like protein [Agrobacterium vitis]|nr:phosphoribosyl transferase-like protein [Agrobacterium vitis]
MGLKIEGNMVIVDHGVKEHLETRVSGNPTKDFIGELPVYSIFKRKRSSAKQARNRELRSLGDNCPLIYALKGMDGLRVEICSIKSLNESIPTIIQNVIDDLEGKFEAVVAMPSSSPLSSILARRLSRASGRPVFLDVFSKSTNAAAMAAVAETLKRDPDVVSEDEVVDVRNALKLLKRIEQETYTAKNIKTRIRKYFTPLAINVVPIQLERDDRILLVDDLLSTGETLRTAHGLLVDLGMQGQHVAATWFSALSKPNGR